MMVIIINIIININFSLVVGVLTVALKPKVTIRYISINAFIICLLKKNKYSDT